MSLIATNALTSWETLSDMLMGYTSDSLNLYLAAPHAMYPGSKLHSS